MVDDRRWVVRSTVDVEWVVVWFPIKGENVSFFKSKVRSRKLTT
jgi:hypothetical protein